MCCAVHCNRTAHSIRSDKECPLIIEPI
jgi:hypothetical protein